MASPATKVRNTVHRLRVLNRMTNRISDALARDPSVTCRRGCASCCYQAVGMTVAEAVFMLDGVHWADWWSQNAEKVEAGVRMWVDEHISRREWMTRKVGCVFLAKNECSLYERRPLSCATYAVVSDPKHCSPDRPNDQVGIVSHPTIEELAWEHLKTNRDLKLPVAIFPMPLALTLARVFRESGTQGVRTRLDLWGAPHGERELADWSIQLLEGKE